MLYILKLAEKFYCLAGKVDDYKVKYPNLSQDIEFFSSNDPSGKNKYLDFAIKSKKEYNDLSNKEISDVINLFDKNQFKLDNKDINSYDIYDLQDLLVKKDLEKTKSQEKREIKDSGSQRIYEDNDTVVLLIKNKDAACHYGFGTRWCISGHENKFYQDYDADNTVFYFIFNKNLTRENNYYKLAVAVNRSKDNGIKSVHVFLADDHQIYDTDSDGIQSPPIENWDKIKSLITSNARSQPRTFLNKVKNNEVPTKQLLEKINEDGVEDVIIEYGDLSKFDEKYIDLILTKINSIKNTKIIDFIERFPKKYYYKLLDEAYAFTNPSLSNTIIFTLVRIFANETNDKNLLETLDKSSLYEDDKKNFIYLVSQKALKNEKSANKRVRMFKLAAATIDMGSPEQAGKGIADIIKFLLRRIDSKNRPFSQERLKSKIWNLNEYQISSKKTPASASLGASITFIKTVLNGHNSHYIREILREIVRNL